MNGNDYEHTGHTPEQHTNAEDNEELLRRRRAETMQNNTAQNPTAARTVRPTGIPQANRNRPAVTQTPAVNRPLQTQSRTPMQAQRRPMQQDGIKTVQGAVPQVNNEPKTQRRPAASPVYPQTQTQSTRKPIQGEYPSPSPAARQNRIQGQVPGQMPHGAGAGNAYAPAPRPSQASPAAPSAPYRTPQMSHQPSQPAQPIPANRQTVSPGQQMKTQVAITPQQKKIPKADIGAAKPDADNIPADIPPVPANSKGAKKGKKAKPSNTKAGADMMVSIVKAIIYMVIVLVVSVFISIFVIRVGNDVFAFVKSDEAIDITIPENATTDDIATILSDNGIINYPSIFKIYASLKHEDGKYIAGNYTVSPSMSYDQLRGEFKEHIATGTTWITIPEGFTTDEIIDLMVENGIGERDKYIDVINNYDFDYWFIDELEASEPKEGRCYRLEGYLFPDTYEFYNSSSEEMVIKRMLDRFDEVFVDDYKTKAAELGYSVDEILTLASIIEKEAPGAAEYMYVSSVFNNRLNNSWAFPKLESDATVAYAIQIETGARPSEVTPDLLTTDSPYNTYQHEGLTPGPIANPSASAIRYALYPANTNNYYFVSANNGTTFYAASKPEHDANIQKVIKLNEDTE